LFTAFDNDGLNTIDARKFVQVLTTGEFLKRAQAGDGRGIHLDQASGRLEIADEATCENMMDAIRAKIIDNCNHIKGVFKHFDQDASGFVDRDEFHLGLTEAGIRISKLAASNLFDSFDVDENGKVEYAEFVAKLQQTKYDDGKADDGAEYMYLERKASHEDPTHILPTIKLPEAMQTPEALLRISTHIKDDNMSSIKNQFSRFDANKDGSVSFEEFAQGLVRLGFLVTEPMARRLFRAFDKDDSKSIEYNEFVRVIGSYDSLV
jgi:protein phosphatase